MLSSGNIPGAVYLVAVSALVTTTFSIPIALANDIEDKILGQIACGHLPDPTPIILDLREQGRIGTGDALRADSRSCWPFSPPLKIGSVGFSHICVSHENPDEVERYPDLYERGPGTSPGTSIGLIGGKSIGAVERWAAKTLPAGAAGYLIEESYMVDGAVEIYCNSLYRGDTPSDGGGNASD